MTKKKGSAKSNFSSADFLNRLRSKDDGAISEIVHEYSLQLYRASLGLGFQGEDAKEVVQRTWVTFFDVVQNFKGNSHIRTFIFGILYNKASEFRRENQRVESTDAIDEIVNDRFDSKGHWVKAPIDPEKFLMAAETREIIEDCLDALPMAQKMAFMMREVEGEETPDICKILNVTITNLGVLIFRARNGLRECIEGKFVGSR